MWNTVLFHLALKPDIETAEKVSDSIKCGNELEEAMAKRDLEAIESSVDNIKKKGFQHDHAEQILQADKLANKLRRLEKLKKEILALDQRTISEIRSYKKPLPAIHDVMIATYVILGYKEKELKVLKDTAHSDRFVRHPNRPIVFFSFCE